MEILIPLAIMIVASIKLMQNHEARQAIKAENDQFYTFFGFHLNRDGLTFDQLESMKQTMVQLERRNAEATDSWAKLNHMSKTAAEDDDEFWMELDQADSKHDQASGQFNAAYKLATKFAPKSFKQDLNDLLDAESYS